MKDLKFKIGIDGRPLIVHYILSSAYAERCIKELLHHQNPSFGFDIETGKIEQYRNDPQAGLCPYRSFPSLLQFYDGTENIYMFDVRELPLEMFQPIFDIKRVIAHNAIFDVTHMTHRGIKNIKADCTMIAYNMVQCAKFASLEEEDEAYSGGALEGEGQVADWITKSERMGASLRAVTAKLLGIRVDKEQQTSNWTDRPLEKEQLMYAAKDAYFTYEIGKILAQDIKQHKLGSVYKLNREAIAPVVQMILNGWSIDEEKHRLHIKEWSKKKDSLEVQIAKIFGAATNIKSFHQIANWLEKKLPKEVKKKWARSEKTGKLKSDAQTLSKFSNLSFVAPLLEFKKLEKMLSTYGTPLLDRICPVTNRLHGSFTLGYTATGRLSSRSPNLQNLPRGEAIREIFRSNSGQLVAADYGQIELRVAAELSRDKQMLGAFATGIDIHALTASKITGRKIDRVTKEDRQLAKSLNFGLLFGLGAKGLIEYAAWNYKVHLDLATAYKHYETFFTTYSGYEEWQRKMRKACDQSNKTSTKMGKARRLLPGKGYTRSVNHPVQGSAAEVVILALNKLNRALPKNIKLISCIHDEIILECDKKHCDIASSVLQQSMEEAYLELFPKASLNKLVDVKTGDTWAATK